MKKQVVLLIMRFLYWSRDGQERRLFCSTSSPRKGKERRPWRDIWLNSSCNRWLKGSTCLILCKLPFWSMGWIPQVARMTSAPQIWCLLWLHPPPERENGDHLKLCISRGGTGVFSCFLSISAGTMPVQKELPILSSLQKKKRRLSLASWQVHLWLSCEAPGVLVA